MHTLPYGSSMSPMIERGSEGWMDATGCWGQMGMHGGKAIYGISTNIVEETKQPWEKVSSRKS